MQARVDGPWRQSLILTGAMFAVSLVVVPIAVVQSGWIGVACAALALAVCLGTGLITLALVGNVGDPAVAAQLSLLGMLPRAGVPLGLVFVVQIGGGVLAESGLVYYVLVYYFANLIVETILLAVGHMGQSARKNRVDRQ